MKLNAPELDLLSQIDAHRGSRKRHAWTTLCSLLIFWAVYWYLSELSEFLVGMLSALTVVALMHAIRVQFEVAPEDKLIEILIRYVNSDAEVITQLSAKGRSTNGGAAA